MKRFVIYAVILGALAIPGLAQRPSGKHQGKGQRLGKKMAQLDKNGDGKISRDEWTRKPKAFDRLDVNQDGFITPEEIKAAHQVRRERKNGRMPSPPPPK